MEEGKMSDHLTKANAEANAVFAKLGEAVDKQLKKGVTELDVIKVAEIAGLKITEADLKELKVNRIIFCHPWLPWYVWFPWRPFWCWWWRRYPWYHCCPWWWHRCHWYPVL